MSLRPAAAPQTNQAGLRTGLIDEEELEKVPWLLRLDGQAVQLLRSLRTVLAAKGSSSKAPAIIVVGSGTT